MGLSDKSEVGGTMSLQSSCHGGAVQSYSRSVEDTKSEELINFFTDSASSFMYSVTLTLQASFELK